MFYKDIPQSIGLCEIYENTVYIARVLSGGSQEVATHPHKCIYNGYCGTCKVSVNPDKKVDTKTRKMCLLISTSELVNLLVTQIEVLKKHIYVKREQYKF